MDNIFIVSDTFCDSRIKIYDNRLNMVHVFGEYGQQDHQLRYPTHLCTGRDGRVFVSDSHNHRIVVYDKNYKLIRTFRSEGSSNDQFECPRG